MNIDVTTAGLSAHLVEEFKRAQKYIGFGANPTISRLHAAYSPGDLP